jgi:glycosyltransferase involved in cell wall biosynthesis
MTTKKRNEPRRIGVVMLDNAGWLASRSFSTVVLEGLARAHDPERERISFLTVDESVTPPAGVEVLRVARHGHSLLSTARRVSLRTRDRFPSLPGEWSMRSRLGLVDPANPIHVARLAGIDVVLPLYNASSLGVDIGTVGWIADFIHRFMPEWFTPAQLAQRDKNYGDLAAGADRMIVSSHSVARHFRAFYPEQAHKLTVAQFPSVFAFHPPSGDPREAVARYGLPAKFALVVNQFWLHKNHLAAINAFRLAADRGVDVPLVMVGALGDLHEPTWRMVGELLHQIARVDRNRRIFLLGPVPSADLTGLLRTAAVVIQPSRFEGWSTTVQDAIALGRPLMCSDIEVLREQAGEEALGFFGCDDPQALADLLVTHWESLSPGPDPAREEAALARAARFAGDYAEILLRVCREAARGR